MDGTWSPGGHSTLEAGERGTWIRRFIVELLEPPPRAKDTKQFGRSIFRVLSEDVDAQTGRPTREKWIVACDMMEEKPIKPTT